MNDLVRDLKYSIRSLAGAPAITLSALISLALGIAINCAIFTIVHHVLLKPLPYDDPDRIVMVWERAIESDDAPRLGQTPAGLLPLSVPNFYDYRDQSTAFEVVSNFNVGDATVIPGAGNEAERVWNAGVFAGFFEVFGVAPQLGRGFLPEEDVPGNNKVVVIDDGLWQRWYDRDPGVIGRALIYEGEESTIVGVMPPGFEFPRNARMWHPAAFPRDFAPRNFNFVYTMARLKPGVTPAAAQAELDTIARQLAEQYPDTNKGKGVYLVRLHDYAVRDVKAALMVLWVAVGFVLLIACGNVASLLTARATARWGEMAMRTALGANRQRLIRQLVTESLVLALAAGALGLVLAQVGLKLLLPLVAGQLPRAGEVGLDATVVLFTVGLSLVSGLLFGLAPALRSSRPDIAQTLKDGAADQRRLSTGGNRVRRVLVVVQVGVAVMLVAAAGLLIRSFTRLLDVDPGFDPANVLTFEVNLPYQQYPDRPRAIGFFKAVQERLAALPGVESVGATWFLPMSGRNAGTGFRIQGDPLNPGQSYVTNLQAVTPGFFETLGIPLVDGRRFNDGDDDGTPGVVMINQEAARRFWPGRDPVGERVDWVAAFGRENYAKADGWEVVGVVADTRSFGLDQEVQPEMYFLNAQANWRWQSFVVRTHQDPLAMVSAVREQVSAVDSDLAIGQVLSLEEIFGRTLSRPRLHTWLMGVFSLVALVLAAVGIYGVVAYTVGLKRHEIAVRLALGAERRDVMRMILIDGLVLGLIGLGLGLVGAVAATRLLGSLLFEVTTTDPPTFIGVSLTLLAVVLLASYVPARLATRVQPHRALRYG